jgi:hypothetical protein
VGNVIIRCTGELTRHHVRVAQILSLPAHLKGYQDEQTGL